MGREKTGTRMVCATVGKKGKEKQRKEGPGKELDQYAVCRIYFFRRGGCTLEWGLELGKKEEIVAENAENHMFVADPAILERSGFFYFFIKKPPPPPQMDVGEVCVCVCVWPRGGDHCTAMVPPFRCFFFCRRGVIYRPLTHTPGSFRSCKRNPPPPRSGPCHIPSEYHCRNVPRLPPPPRPFRIRQNRLWAGRVSE